MAESEDGGRGSKPEGGWNGRTDPAGPEVAGAEQSLGARRDHGKPPQLTYDPQERAAEKARAREQDEEDLKSGKVTPEQLSKRNGFFSSLDLRNARIVRPRGKFK